MADPQQTLAGRVALVTGASRGIGAAISRRLASAGAQVVATARSVETSTGLPGTLWEVVKQIESEGGRAHALACDVLDPEQRRAAVDHTVSRLGRLDVLVNNAGAPYYATVEQLSQDAYAATVGAYFDAPCHLSQLAIPHMRAQGGGWILNIGSSTVELPAGPPFDAFASGGGLTLYASMKAALHRLTRGLAAEVHADGIAVNCVGPVGAIATPGVVAAGVIPTDMPGITEPIELIAEAALYLCSGEPRERTGFVGYTRPLLAEAGVPVRSLDGATVASDDPAHVPG